MDLRQAERIKWPELSRLNPANKIDQGNDETDRDFQEAGA